MKRGGRVVGWGKSAAVPGLQKPCLEKQTFWAKAAFVRCGFAVPPILPTFHPPIHPAFRAWYNKVMLPMMVDTHAHLCDDGLWDEAPAMLGRAAEVGVRKILCVGYDGETSRRAVELAQAHIGVGATVGIHPTNIMDAAPEDFERVAAWAAGLDVVAVGETGLDFYHDSTPHERQREVFQWHLALAKEHSLPLTIHSRCAEEAALDEIALHPGAQGAMHCFGGDRAAARRALEKGLYIGVDGPVTFKKSVELQDLVRWLPLDRLLLETDSPYLSPHPFRGKRNDPSRLPTIAEAVALLKGLTVEEVACATTENAFRLFGRLKGRPDLEIGNAE